MEEQAESADLGHELGYDCLQRPDDLEGAHVPDQIRVTRGSGALRFNGACIPKRRYTVLEQPG